MTRRPLASTFLAGRGLHYAVAVIAVGAALAGGLGLETHLNIMPFASLFLCAILISARLGGAGPGLLATALGVLAFVYFIAPPRYSFVLASQEALRIVPFGIAALLVVWVCAAQKRTAESLLRARDDLQGTVRELRTKEHELRLMIDTIPALVITAWPDGKLDFVNGYWRKQGFAESDLAKMRDDPFAIIHPDDVAAVREVRNRSVARDEPYECELRLRKANGEYRWYLNRTAILRDDTGKAVKRYTTATDIDDYKKAEQALRREVTATQRAQEALQTAQTELAHVTRVTTLGEMSASIAHEMNQPLASIVASGAAGLRWLRRDVPDVGKATASLERIVESAHRTGAVIRGIREFSKKADPEMIRLDVNEVVEGAIALLRHEALGHGVVTKLELGSGLPAVRGDRIQLQQVIINLAVNGIQAMAGVNDRERVLTVRTQRDETGQVLVAVEDAGIGIKPENTDRLFTPFYTTKSNGLGMGLSICRSIIQAHGGQLSAAPNAGPGMTFRFALSGYRNGN